MLATSAADIRRAKKQKKIAALMGIEGGHAIENSLAALREFIELDDPAAAHRVALHIVENVETLLPANLKMGRPGRVPGTRELVIPNALYNILCHIA